MSFEQVISDEERNPRKRGSFNPVIQMTFHFLVRVQSSTRETLNSIFPDPKLYKIIINQVDVIDFILDS